MINEPVHIISYDSEWPIDYEKEKTLLEQALNDPCAAYEHIGSTSVPGMSAKPIVDIMIGIENYPPVPEWINKLCSLGYSFYGEAGVPERLYFTRRGKKNFNLAVVLFNGSHWKYNIKVRNFLQKHPEVCREYEKIKTRAINFGANQLISYSDFKKDFLQSLCDKMNDNTDNRMA